jgi:hypothetical protein
MNRTRRVALSVALCFGLGLSVSACGGDSLSRPESLPLHSYPADREFRMSFVMSSCSDPCAEYEAGDCSVDVDAEDLKISVDVSVSYSDKDGVERETCALTCGKPVLAHCDVSSIPAGTYSVTADTFSTSIDVQ